MGRTRETRAKADTGSPNAQDTWIPVTLLLLNGEKSSDVLESRLACDTPTSLHYRASWNFRSSCEVKETSRSVSVSSNTFIRNRKCSSRKMELNPTTAPR